MDIGGKRQFAVCVGVIKALFHVTQREWNFFFFIPSFSPGIIYASYPGKCFSIG